MTITFLSHCVRFPVTVIIACSGKMTLVLQKCYCRAVLLLSVFAFIIQAGCFFVIKKKKKKKFVCSPHTCGHFRHSAPPSSIHAVWCLLFCAQVSYLMIYVFHIPQAHFWGVTSRASLVTHSSSSTTNARFYFAMFLLSYGPFLHLFPLIHQLNSHEYIKTPLHTFLTLSPCFRWSTPILSFTVH